MTQSKPTYIGSEMTDAEILDDVSEDYRRLTIHSGRRRFAARLQALCGLLAPRNSEEIMNTETLIATLEAAPGIIIGLIREVPPQNLKRRPAPNKWSAHEHACHISSGHAPFLSRLELMLSYPHPQIKSIVPSTDEEAGSLLSVDL